MITKNYIVNIQLPILYQADQSFKNYLLYKLCTKIGLSLTRDVQDFSTINLILFNTISNTY